MKQSRYPSRFRPRHAPFPRASTTFVGRRAELDRALELIDRETLFLVYGVGGIGKTEYVYKLIEEARARPRFSAAPAILIPSRPGTGAEHLLAMLKLRLGAAPVASVAGRFEDDLEEVGGILDAAPHLVFLDDLHVLPVEGVSRVLSWLARHVRASRIFAASRVELPLLARTPPPIVTRLGPLDVAATGELVAAVTHRLGIGVRDAAKIHRRSGGSPFYVQRELASDEGADDPLAATLHDLGPVERRALLCAIAMRGRTSPAELERAVGEGASGALRALARRFLVDLDRDIVIVHDLVREAALAASPREETAEARRVAARHALARWEAEPHDNVLDAIDAVRLLVAAGEMRAAWALVERCYRVVGAAGLDHLLLPQLDELGAALGDERHAIDVLAARILVRRSHITEAGEALLRAGREPGTASSVRYLLMAGLVAQHLGDLGRAEELFTRALDGAEDAAERFRALLSLAVVAAWRGDGERARALLSRIETELPPLVPRERGRWGWVWTFALVLEFRFEEAADSARRTIRLLDEQDESALPARSDLALMCAMLATLASAEADDLAEAQRLLDEAIAPAIAGRTLRGGLASLYRGVVLFAAGDMRGASAALEGTFTELVAHRDHLHACLAGHYLGCALSAMGETAQALDVLERTTDAAAAAGLASLAPHGMAVHAEALLHAGRAEAARARAEAALAQARVPRTKILAHTVLGAIAEAPAPHLDAVRAVSATGGASHGAARAASDSLAIAELALRCRRHDEAVDHAARARRHYHAAGRQWHEARACLVLAEAGDRAALARARELSEAHGYAPLRARLGAPPPAPFDLELELASGTIAAATGRSVKGRPITCALLARLIAAKGAVVDAETLYRDVWGGREYHPLRHRNTVYVGVNRLRRALKELIPSGDPIETVPSGWRLSPSLHSRIR